MISHLPILQVIVPLMAAPICLILRKQNLLWLFAIVASGLAFIISVLLLQQVMQTGVIIYEVGGWNAPWGIEYRIDYLNAYVLLIISAISTIVLFAAHTSLQKERKRERHSLFYVVYLLCLAGMLGIVATADVFNLFVFLEISSLSSYALIGMGNDRRALWASYQYLIMGTIGATFILIGIGLMYIMTGTLNMYDLAQRLPEVADSRTVFTAFAFFIVGVCLKLALFPLHLWLPNAYAYAPSVVTAFLAATATKVAIYVLIRFIFSVYGLEYSVNRLPFQYILLVLSMAGIFIASITAIYPLNIKRLFAYSSVAQIAYMILGISIGSTTGLMATLLHLFNHALMKSALFLALAAVFYRTGSVRISHFEGLGRRMPWTMAAIVIGGLSLVGVPLTVGFISKWFLVLAALQQGWWLVAFLILIGSMIALIYVWRIVEAAYFKHDNGKNGAVKEAPLSLLVPTWILVLANLYFGIDTRLTIGVAEIAAQTLIGITP